MYGLACEQTLRFSALRRKAYNTLDWLACAALARSVICPEAVLDELTKADNLVIHLLLFQRSPATILNQIPTTKTLDYSLPNAWCLDSTFRPC